jgi:hypothetical protein
MTSGKTRETAKTFFSTWNRHAYLYVGRWSTSVLINLSLILKNELWKSICICSVLSAFDNSGSQEREWEGNCKIFSNDMVFGLNVGRETHHPDRGFSWLSSVPPSRCRDNTSNQAMPVFFRNLSTSLLFYPWVGIIYEKIQRRLNCMGAQVQKRNIYANMYPSSRTMALGSTQPRTEMSTRNLPGVKGGRRVRLTILPPSVSRLSRENVGASTSHNRMGLHGLLQG